MSRISMRGGAGDGQSRGRRSKGIQESHRRLRSEMVLLNCRDTLPRTVRNRCLCANLIKPWTASYLVSRVVLLTRILYPPSIAGLIKHPRELNPVARIDDYRLFRHLFSGGGNTSTMTLLRLNGGGLSSGTICLSRPADSPVSSCLWA